MKNDNVIYKIDDIAHCITPTSRKLNKDGYFRRRDYRSDTKGRKPLIMNHRLKWEEVNGEIPKGLEIDHICGNRACCNIEHLQVLTNKQHTIKTNIERSKERLDKAKEYWLLTKCTGTTLGIQFDVSFGQACHWIRNWKKGVETKLSIKT